MKNKRLYPPLYSNLYYHLKCIRKSINDALKICLNKISNLANNKLIVIDAGSGSQPYKELVTKHDMIYKAAEIDLVNDKDYVIRMDGKFLIESGVADIVLSTQVLEHVYEYDFYLRECNRILNDNGLLIISTHGHWVYHPDPNDYWRWTIDGLRCVLERNGFNVLHSEGIMGIKSTSLQFFQDKTRNFFRFKILISLYTFFMQQLIQLIDRFDKNKDSDAAVFMMVAEKKSK